MPSDNKKAFVPYVGYYPATKIKSVSIYVGYYPTKIKNTNKLMPGKKDIVPVTIEPQRVQQRISCFSLQIRKLQT